MNKPLILLIIVLGAFYLLGSGCVDIDWMVTGYYFDFSNGLNGYWKFTPWFSMLWWDAYFFTLMRIVFGAGILGSTLTYIYLKLKGNITI